MKVYYIYMIGLTTTGYFIEKKRNSKKMQTFFLIFAGILLLLLSTVRYAIGFDYFSYRSIFNTIREMDLKEVIINYKTEFLFAFLNWLVAFLGGNYTTFLFVVNLFLQGTIIWFIKQYSKLPWLSIYLFLTLQFFAHSMNLLRQSISVAFFLIAFPMLKEKRWISYSILMIIGGFFHNSAFIFLLIGLFLHIKNSWEMMGIIGSLFLLIYFKMDVLFEFLLEHVFVSYSSYFNSVYWRGNSIKYCIVPSIYFILVLFARKKLLKQSKENNLYINSAFLTFLNYLFITKHFILERFAVYFFILSIVIIPEIIDIYRKEEKKRMADFILIGSIVVSTIYFFFAAYEGFHNVYPFVSWLDKV